MADTQLAVRYTDEAYLSRSEVANALGTSLIDPIWNTILSYRNTYRRQLSVFDVTKIKYSICYFPKLGERITALEQKVSEYIVNFGGLTDGSISRYTLFREMCSNELRHIAKVNKISVNDVALNNIVEYKSVDSIYTPLVRYFNALVRLEKNPKGEFNEETIASFYQIVSGIENLDSLYRKSEINAQTQRLLINREYAGAPVHEIQNQMKSLINYINTSKDSFITKMAVLIYVINYVKPFEKCNAEMAIILAKAVASYNDIESASVYIPIESIASDDKGVYSKTSREIQRSRDLTYQVTRVIESFNEALQIVMDRMVQLTVDGVKNSFFLGEDKEEFKQEFGFEAPKEIIDETVKEEIIEQPKVEKVVEVEKKSEVAPVRVEPVHIKLAEEEDELSDKQLKRLANKLLESDPFLKKGQAHFYVRHCSKGKYYTIQQYKKCEGCVYETARTSMDNLAKLGYYRREQIKNKFVYTPIDKE